MPRHFGVRNFEATIKDSWGWRYGSSSRVPSLEFKPQSHKKKKKKKERKRKKRLLAFFGDWSLDTLLLFLFHLLGIFFFINVYYFS
jgi:hypothetical protein